MMPESRYENPVRRGTVPQTRFCGFGCSRSRARALTLIEIIVSLAIMAIIIAVIVPLFVAMRNSWDSKQGAAETLQNGRVLIDHLNRNLSKAVKITDVSGSSEPNGFIVFQDNDGNNLRYDINSTSSYVEFGYLGDLSDLAGPVSQLQFSCYDACDLDTPLSSPIDANTIRFIKAETTLTNSSGQDRTFTASAYLRTNSSTGDGGTAWGMAKGTNLEFDTKNGLTPALVQIDTTHYLCAYTGDKGGGYAVVLTVDTDTNDITAETPLEYDTKRGEFPALVQIDNNHYLCAYTGVDSDGFAVVLIVNTDTWEITKGTETPLEYDISNGQYPVLAQIDNTHYFCVYRGINYGLAAVVLTVNTDTWEITKETPFESGYQNKGRWPALAQIDNSHYLCAYYEDDPNSDGWADVLAVDTNTWTITTESTLEYDPDKGEYPALAKIDDNHYLCAYKGPDTDGWATVLTVDTGGDWSISNGTAFEFDSVSAEAPALAKIDSTHYLCAYNGHVSSLAENGWATILTVDTGNWTVSQEEALLEYDADCGVTPDLAKINDSLFLCAYEGRLTDGWSVVISVTPASGGGEIRP